MILGRAGSPQVSGRLDRFLQRSDDILTRHRELPALMYPSFQVLSQRLPSDSKGVPVD